MSGYRTGACKARIKNDLRALLDDDRLVQVRSRYLILPTAHGRCFRTAHFLDDPDPPPLLSAEQRNGCFQDFPPLQTLHYRSGSLLSYDTVIQVMYQLKRPSNPAGLHAQMHNHVSSSLVTHSQTCSLRAPLRDILLIAANTVSSSPVSI